MEQQWTGESLYSSIPMETLHFRLLRRLANNAAAKTAVDSLEADLGNLHISGKKVDPQFELKVFCHKDAPEYHALSYTVRKPQDKPILTTCVLIFTPLFKWGCPFPPDDPLATEIDWSTAEHVFEINNQPFHVHRNLADLLNELPNLPLDDKWIWVDAICINQTDIEERASQVTQMGQIYTKARSVVTWLGCADETTEYASNLGTLFMEPLCVILDEVRSFRKGFASLDLLNPESLKAFGIPNPPLSWWEAWEKYHERSWFYRRWVLQECVLNFNNAKMFCGKWPLDPMRHDWPMIRILKPKSWEYRLILPPGLMSIEDIISPFFNIPPPDDKQGMNVGIAHDEFLERLEFIDKIPTFPAILKILLEQARGHTVTNPLDAVYGLFGLADHLLELYNVKRTRKLQVDYRRPTWVLYQIVAVILLEGTPSLSLLSFWPNLTIHNIDRLPSWVPDFSRHFTDEDRYTQIFAHEKGIAFNAADIQHKFPAVRKAKGNRLTIRGCRIDTIQACAATIESSAEDWAMFPSMLELCLEMELAYRNGQDRVEVLWETMNWGLPQSNGDKPSTAEAIEKFRSYILGNLQCRVYRMAAFESYADGSYEGVDDPRQIVREQAEAHFKILQLCEKLSKESSVRLPSIEDYTDWVTRFVAAYCHAEDDAAREEAISKFSWEAVRNSTSGNNKYYDRRMRLFRGVEGYLGLGPTPSAVGDEVWILENSRVPFILRRADDGVDGERRLLGEAYVHGVMHRELFMYKTEDEKPKFEEVFII